MSRNILSFYKKRKKSPSPSSPISDRDSSLSIFPPVNPNQPAEESHDIMNIDSIDNYISSTPVQMSLGTHTVSSFFQNKRKPCQPLLESYPGRNMGLNTMKISIRAFASPAGCFCLLRQKSHSLYLDFVIGNMLKVRVWKLTVKVRSKKRRKALTSMPAVIRIKRLWDSGQTVKNVHTMHHYSTHFLRDHNRPATMAVRSI